MRKVIPILIMLFFIAFLIDASRFTSKNDASEYSDYGFEKGDEKWRLVEVLKSNGDFDVFFEEKELEGYVLLLELDSLACSTFGFFEEVKLVGNSAFGKTYTDFMLIRNKKDSYFLAFEDLKTGDYQLEIYDQFRNRYTWDLTIEDRYNQFNRYSLKDIIKANEAYEYQIVQGLVTEDLDSADFNRIELIYSMGSNYCEMRRIVVEVPTFQVATNVSLNIYEKNETAVNQVYYGIEKADILYEDLKVLELNAKVKSEQPEYICENISSEELKVIVGDYIAYYKIKDCSYLLLKDVQDFINKYAGSIVE